jgi:hypothetical protein
MPSRPLFKNLKSQLMKIRFLLTLLALPSAILFAQQNVGIGTTSPAPTSLLDLNSTNKGLLIPRMTGAERVAIASPATGLLVYQTDTHQAPPAAPTTPGFYVYEITGTAGSWKRIARKDEIPFVPTPTWSSTGNDQYNSNAGGVGIGTSAAPNASSILDVASTTKGFLFPRMTYAQRIAIQTPAPGLLVYQTDAVGQFWVSGIYFYDGAIWKRIARADEISGGGGGPSSWTTVGDDQFSNLAGNVGIGTGTPTSKFHLVGNMLTESGSFTINNPTAILQLQNAGVNKGFLQLSGNNVRIGTNSGNTGGEFIVRMNGNTNMVIDSTGDMGIGIADPERKLHVEGGSIMVAHPGSIVGVPYAPTVTFKMTAEDEKKGGMRFIRDGSYLAEMMYTVDADGPNYISLSADGSGKKDIFLNSNSRVGINMNGSTFNPLAQLHVRATSGNDAMAIHSTLTSDNATIQFYDASISGGNANDKKTFIELQDGNNLRMGTNSGNNVGDLIIRMDGTDRVMVDQAGKVGIGTFPPIAKLHVDGGDDAEPNPFDGNGYLMLGDPIHTNVIFDNNEILARDGANSATLTVQNDGGAFKVGSTNRLFVGDNGNVGINTGNPLAKLDVIGRIRVDQDNEAIGITGNNPYIGLWFNDIYRSKIQQLTDQLYIHSNDKVHLDGDQIAIGNMLGTADGYKLTVTGKIICEELKVELTANWPDYVFADEYQLKPLYELKSFIETNHHLPNIPTAIDVEKEGFEVGEMNRKLLEKVEELTLYVIALQEQIDQLKSSTHK